MDKRQLIVTGALDKKANIPWYLTGGIAAANCVVAYKPKGAADIAASYVNLNNPGTNNATPVTPPTWDATNGWIFLAASSQYLTCGFTPDATYTTIVRYTGIPTIGGNFVIFGAQTGTGNSYQMWPYLSNKAYFRNGGSFNTDVGYPNWVLGMAGQKACVNGAYAGDITTGVSTFAVMTIGRFGSNSQYYLTGNIQAFVAYNITITEPQLAAVTAAMVAL